MIFFQELFSGEVVHNYIMLTCLSKVSFSFPNSLETNFKWINEIENS